MHELDLLRSIRPTWLNRATLTLARGAGLREDLRSQLVQFIDLVEQAVETGNNGWLDPLLSMWATSLTQTDLESGSSSLLQFINVLTMRALDVSRETLSETDALDLLNVLMPCFTYAFEKAAQFEMQARVAYVSNQLTQVKQTLERLDRSKSDFISVAAHELRTPLTLVEGYAAMLRENVEPRSKPDSAEVILLRGISTGTLRLRAIIEDMIDVSLIDNNLLSLNFQPIWVNRHLAALCSELETIIRERNIQLEIKSFPGSNERTFADPERILQVLRNIMTNAIKYTPDGGKITVSGRKLPGFLEITIQDTGIGIAPEDQVLIFEKFGRIGNIALHSSGKTKFKGGGPGLGLHIAKGILEAHGGTIWVESSGYDEENLPGSTFHILLPLRIHPPDDKAAKLFANVIPPAPPEEKHDTRNQSTDRQLH